MSRRSRTVLCCFVLLGITGATSAFLITRASPEPAPDMQTTAQPSTANKGSRNFNLQPEAVRAAKQLGKRFDAFSRATSVLAGTLTISGTVQPLTLTRRQTETGEQVNLLVGDRNLTWSDQEGTKAGADLPSEADRLLVERLTHDSPDQFVLAQLRGASYFTIAHHVRLPDAADGYDGPLWDVVRVDDTVADEAKKLESSWRLYYVNVKTRLIDRVVYELRGEPIQAEFLNWTDYQGERVPARIVWRKGATPVMEFQMTSFSQPSVTQ